MGEKRFYKRPLFWIVFGIPNIISAGYFLLLAAPQYVSTAKVIVYQESNSPQHKVSINGKSGGASLEGDYLLGAYIQSEKAFLSFPGNVLAQHWSRGFGVADYGGLLQGFRKSELNLWKTYKDNVYIHTNRESAVMEIRIQSYNKNFSQWLNNELLFRGQRAISHLSRSVYEETIAFDKNLVKKQKQTLSQAITSLSAYQKETGIINLDSGYSSELRTLGQMEINESTLFSRVSTYRKLEPNNPQYEALTTQLKAIQGSIQEIKSRIHGEGSLAAHAKAYTLRYTAMKNANKLLDIDEKALILAQQNLLSHRYVISYISPASSPIAPTRPYRWWNTFWVLLGTSVLYMILK